MRRYSIWRARYYLCDVKLQRKFADMWVGVYWTSGPFGLILWICVVPCFPIRVIFRKWYPLNANPKQETKSI